LRSKGGLISVEVDPLRPGSWASMGQFSSANAAEFKHNKTRQRTKLNVGILSDVTLSPIGLQLSISFNQIRLFWELTYPDISKTDGITVILQMDIATFMRAILSLFLVKGRALDLEIIVHNDAVM